MSPTKLPIDQLLESDVPCRPRHNERVVTFSSTGNRATVVFRVEFGDQTKFGQRVLIMVKLGQVWRQQGEYFVPEPEVFQARRGAGHSGNPSGIINREIPEYEPIVLDPAKERALDYQVMLRAAKVRSMTAASGLWQQVQARSALDKELAKKFPTWRFNWEV